MILAVDQGTTGTTCLVISDELRTLGRGYREIRQSFPRPGLVEHDPDEIWASVEAAAADALDAAGLRAADLAAIGIANQRETTVVWERRTGRPVHPAIVWQDRRTAERCEQLRQDGHEPRVTEISGLLLDPYFSGTKVAWLLDRVEGARAR
ncbi:MAG: FGGY family carbohydrate kinase, partial [Planctomycetaceae bacterium]